MTAATKGRQKSADAREKDKTVAKVRCGIFELPEFDISLVRIVIDVIYRLPLQSNSYVTIR